MINYDEIIQKAKTYVNRNIEHGISVEEIARFAGYSSKQLTRIFSMITGITPGEYLRWTKLSKAVYEIKYSDAPILDIAIKYNYESQESFSRAFKDIFGVNPGDYRKSNKNIEPDNWHIKNIIHEQSHEAALNGVYAKQEVNSWVVTHPKRIWASARHNHENLPANEFYGMCGREGVMDKTGALHEVIIEGGAILVMEGHHEEKPGKNQLCFGVMVAEDYPRGLLEGYKLYHLPEMQYVVFNCPPYARETHGSVIQSIWNAQREYEPEKYGFEWCYEAPIIEADSNDFGYTMWFPIKAKHNS